LRTGFKYYLKENVPFLDVTDTSYWLVDKSLKPVPEVAAPTPMPEPGGTETTSPNPPEPTPEPGGAELKSITVSGKVPLEHFHELFQCFIAPFAPNGNKVEIQVSFKISSTENNALSESKPQYKNAKEAAKQLGLNFEEENN